MDISLQFKMELQKYLVENSLSVMEFAEKTGVHFNTIYRVLKGENLSPPVMERIAEIMGKKLVIVLENKVT